MPVLFGRHNLPFTRLSWQTLAPPGTTRLPIPSTYFSKYLKLKDITFSHLKKRKCYEWPTWCPRVCCRPILYFFLFVVSAQVSLCCSAYLHWLGSNISLSMRTKSPLLLHIRRFQDYFNHIHIFIGSTTLQFLQFWYQNGVNNVGYLLNILFLLVKSIGWHEARWRSSWNIWHLRELSQITFTFRGG